MPVLQHERAPTHKRLTPRQSPRAADQSFQAGDIEQAIAQLNDTFHLCLGETPREYSRTGVSALVLIDLANVDYFAFDRIITREEHLLAALGPRWHAKLELIACLAIALQEFARAQSLNPDDSRLQGRWTEALSIPFMAECLSRAAGYRRPSEAWVGGLILSILGFAHACRELEEQTQLSANAISHLDARDSILTLVKVERVVRTLELSKGFSTSRVARQAGLESPWPTVAAACFLEVSSRRNLWVAEIASNLERLSLGAPVQRALMLKGNEITQVSAEIALIAWKAASKSRMRLS